MPMNKGGTLSAVGIEIAMVHASMPITVVGTSTTDG